MRPNRTGTLADRLKGFFDRHLSFVQDAIASGQTNVPSDVVALYPSFLLFTETRSHYLVELAGATDRFSGLTAKRQGGSSTRWSTSRWLSQFYNKSEQPILTINAGWIVFEGVCFADTADWEHLVRRFPAAAGFAHGYQLRRAEGRGALVQFGPEVQAASFHNVLFVHRCEAAFRVRHAFYLLVLRKSIAPGELLTHLQSVFDPCKSLQGVAFAAGAEAQARLLAGQFQNLYLMPKLQETMIGEFLRQHPEVLTRALQATRIVYEPSCPWRVSSPDPDEKAINPDFFAQRSDGAWDVYELKTAALDRKDLTRGPRRRRRFVDYISEGVAQLAHYADYIAQPENRAFLEQKYGGRFENPRLGLIVGSEENLSPGRLAEAKRALRELTIIDYDTLVRFFLAGVASSGNLLR